MLSDPKLSETNKKRIAVSVRDQHQPKNTTSLMSSTVPILYPPHRFSSSLSPSLFATLSDIAAHLPTSPAGGSNKKPVERNDEWEEPNFVLVSALPTLSTLTTNLPTKTNDKVCELLKMQETEKLVNKLTNNRFCCLMNGMIYSVLSVLLSTKELIEFATFKKINRPACSICFKHFP